MKEDFKIISVIILISIITVYFCNVIGSTSIFEYLNENLITILVGFLAINTATLGHLAAKIQDVMLVHKELDFSNTTFEMKKSLTEQIILIAISVILIIIEKSTLNFYLKTEIVNIISFSVFLYAINILWDTGKSVFIIIEEIRKLNK